MAIYDQQCLNGAITFNESKPVFYSGQVLSGKVNFQLNSPLHISGINIVYLGDANVEWTEEQSELYGSVSRLRIIKYNGREEYFNSVQSISQGLSVLPTGAHSVPFSYQIPFTAPSSFKGDKGQVTYKVVANIVHQDGLTKETIVSEFDVVAPLNLNTGSDDIKSPLVMEFEQVITCDCFCSSKPLSVVVRLPAHGFCPGQTVPITVDANNKSRVEVTKILFQITSRERYRSQQPVSEYEPPEEVLAELKKGPILSNTCRQYAFEITVPEFIAPNMENCGIIDIGFFFKVKMRLSGCNEDMEDEAEICIGLVPLGGSTDVKLSHPMADKLPNGPIPDANIPPLEIPPTYNPTFINENMVQICPPGPIPYPIVANEADKPIFGSKNNLLGPFELGFQSQTGANTTSSHSVPAYTFPSLPQTQYPPYPNQPNAQPSAPPAY